jgi:hypothetical protein
MLMKIDPIRGYFCISDHNVILNNYGDTHTWSWRKMPSFVTQMRCITTKRRYTLVVRKRSRQILYLWFLFEQSYVRKLLWFFSGTSVSNHCTLPLYIAFNINLSSYTGINCNASGYNIFELFRTQATARYRRPAQPNQATRHETTVCWGDWSKGDAITW